MREKVLYTEGQPKEASLTAFHQTNPQPQDSAEDPDLWTANWLQSPINRITKGTKRQCIATARAALLFFALRCTRLVVTRLVSLRRLNRFR